MLLIQCIFLQSVYQPTHTLSKIQYVTSMKLRRVSCLGCYPQGVFWNVGMEVLTGMIKLL